MEKRKTINCQVCGCEMAWERPDEPGNFIASSCYLGDNWLICHDCMEEYCNLTNCYGCRYSKYPGCRFQYLKKHCSNDSDVAEAKGMRK